MDTIQWTYETPEGNEISVDFPAFIMYCHECANDATHDCQNCYGQGSWLEVDETTLDTEQRAQYEIYIEELRAIALEEQFDDAVRKSEYNGY